MGVQVSKDSIWPAGAHFWARLKTLVVAASDRSTKTCILELMDPDLDRATFSTNGRGKFDLKIVYVDKLCTTNSARRMSMQRLSLHDLKCSSTSLNENLLHVFKTCLHASGS